MTPKKNQAKKHKHENRRSSCIKIKGKTTTVDKQEPNQYKKQNVKFKKNTLKTHDDNHQEGDGPVIGGEASTIARGVG